jgi:hypothetical protein
MKPVYIGLLVFAATVGIGLLAIFTLSPAPKAVDVAVPPPAAIGPVPAPARETTRPRRKTREARKTTPAQTFRPEEEKTDPFPKPPIAGRPAGGVFSGSDPSDPRVYH